MKTKGISDESIKTPASIISLILYWSMAINQNYNLMEAV